MLELMFLQESHLLYKRNLHHYLVHGVKQKKLFSNNNLHILENKCKEQENHLKRMQNY